MEDGDAETCKPSQREEHSGPMGQCKSMSTPIEPEVAATIQITTAVNRATAAEPNNRDIYDRLLGLGEVDASLLYNRPLSIWGPCTTLVDRT